MKFRQLPPRWSILLDRWSWRPLSGRASSPSAAARVVQQVSMLPNPNCPRLPGSKPLRSLPRVLKFCNNLPAGPRIWPMLWCLPFQCDCKIVASGSRCRAGTCHEPDFGVLRKILLGKCSREFHRILLNWLAEVLAFCAVIVCFEVFLTEVFCSNLRRVPLDPINMR